MSLRDEMDLYTELSGNDGYHTPIGIIGAYLDGYENGKASAQQEPTLDQVRKYCKKRSLVLITAELFYKLTRTQLDIVLCNECRHYQGVHGAIGHAPCSYWNSGGVMWDWYCSQGERTE